jgi:hypothetical protein
MAMPILVEKKNLNVALYEMIIVSYYHISMLIVVIMFAICIQFSHLCILCWA